MLPVKQLDSVRLLAKEGCREHTIRRALGYTPSQWKALKEATTDDGELSPLALALEEGRASLCDEMLAIMLELARKQKDRHSVQWLLEHVGRITRPSDAIEDTAPRISIVLNAALTPEEYQRGITIEHD